MNAKELFQRFRWQSIAVALGLFLVGFGVYRDLGLPELVAQQEQTARRANTLRSNVLNSISLGEHLEQLRKVNQEVEQRVARASDLAGNTQYFYRLEAEAGVKEISLTPVAAKTPGKSTGSVFTRVTFNHVVEGKLPAILAYLGQLEGGAWFGRIATCNLRHAANADLRNDPVMSATLTVEILALP